MVTDICLDNATARSSARAGRSTAGRQGQLQISGSSLFDQKVVLLVPIKSVLAPKRDVGEVKARAGSGGQ